MTNVAVSKEEFVTSWDESLAAFSVRGLRPVDMRPTYVNAYSITGNETWPIDQPNRHLRIHVTGPTEGTLAFSRTVQSINELLALPHGWDSYGGMPPSERGARKVIAMLASFAAAGGKMPAIVPVSDGGLQLEWHNSGVDLEIEIDRSGAVSAYVERQNEAPLAWTNHQLPTDPRFAEALSTVLFPEGV